jgi:hypothetical protein
MVSTTLAVKRCISALKGSLSVRNLTPGMKCSHSGKPLITSTNSEHGSVHVIFFFFREFRVGERASC